MWAKKENADARICGTYAYDSFLDSQLYFVDLLFSYFQYSMHIEYSLILLITNVIFCYRVSGVNLEQASFDIKLLLQRASGPPIHATVSYLWPLLALDYMIEHDPSLSVTIRFKNVSNSFRFSDFLQV